MNDNKDGMFVKRQEAKVEPIEEGWKALQSCKALWDEAHK